MLFPTLFWIMVVVSAALCCIGFYRFVWFMSVGYGLAVAGCGATMLIAALMGGTYSIPYLLICLLFIIYGCRLGLFLLFREIKNAAYKKTLDAQMTKKIPIFVQAIMWIMMAFLYPIQCSPVLYRLINGGMTTGGDLLTWIGAVIMIIGVAMESLADKQKSASKKINPKMVAMDGLYKIVRCPNYLGEILVWTGCFVSGLNILKGFQWIIAIFGYVCIVYIMISGANRISKRQDKNYGDKPEYQAYIKNTKLLIPFIF